MIGKKLESNVFCLPVSVSNAISLPKKNSDSNVNIEFWRETSSRFPSGAFSLPDYFPLSLFLQFIRIECSVDDDGILQVVLPSRVIHSATATVLLDVGTGPLPTVTES